MDPIQLKGHYIAIVQGALIARALFVRLTRSAVRPVFHGLDDIESLRSEFAKIGSIIINWR
jgi:hypothetical protein